LSYAGIAGFRSDKKRAGGVGEHSRAGRRCIGLLVRLFRRVRSSNNPLQACSSVLAQTLAAVHPGWRDLGLLPGRAYVGLLRHGFARQAASAMPGFLAVAQRGTPDLRNA
jgi:hypothetical protein